ncbi:hypothetical protein F5Y08DRAFT_324452 [Xylaria arbuscula]|nr:hypothetical protein F5Y08DRAFT_324452 [Xylaria arbuscula]
MASCRGMSLDSLPLFILEDICTYLASSCDQGEDGEKPREGLWAISLASRCCYWAAAKERFRQIRVVFSNVAKFEDDLKSIDKLLTTGSHFHHVRQLILMFPDYHDDGFEDTSFLDVHPQLRPARVTLCKHWVVTTLAANAQEMWQTLSGLINRMQGLRDFVFALPYHLDPCVLGAVHGVGCRLHMHCFSLRSLYQPQNELRDVSLDDYALLSSPSLYSVVLSTARYDMNGLMDYHEEALSRMVAGTAPGLAHVWLRRRPIPYTVAMARLSLNPRPNWLGFFPRGEGQHEEPSIGNLKSLVLHHSAISEINLVSWTQVTSFPALSSLTLSLRWYESTMYRQCCESLHQLLHMAKQGQLVSLKSLILLHCGDPLQGNNSEFLATLILFLNTIGPLQNLHVPHDDILRMDTLSVAVSRHTLSSCCQIVSQRTAVHISH